MSAIILEDRGVVEVGGPDAAKFLHNLVTNDIAKLLPGQARFCALLAPQGKILFDFLVFAVGEGEDRRYLLDCPLALVGDLVKRLGMYKLRANVTVTPRSGELVSYAFLAAEKPQAEAVALAEDPRSERLGWRALAQQGAIPASGGRADYDAARVAAGIPEGGLDFAYGDAFPHEANMDLIAGVDFTKGCYVGQEVVSRTKHRNLARKRVAPYRTSQGQAPAPGAAVRAGEIDIGLTGSHSGEIGLALIRLDKLADAAAAGIATTAEGVSLEFAAPSGAS
ncbi:YgfZ/GcvT domain-containing protein [Methylocystis heyeri]|uniref:Folate-binding protein n=1 Tax=Methylocystis heyeri TaxID=391905 RepID=A0A6B8KDA7_9HYPH|nr:folate-binding protein YgfZ [Methylocystis heyeri]QGM45582.1 folate-binding protein [Methylocystis heyeri]